MKSILFTLFVLFFWSVNAQLKELTLKDAVLLQNRSFAPERISSFQWIPGTDTYSFVSKNGLMLMKSGVKATVDTDLISIEEVNKACGTSFSRFMGLEWLTETSFRMNDGQTYTEFDVISKKGMVLHKMDDSSLNALLNPVSLAIAYTKENNVYLKTKGGSEFAVTANKDKNIVSGQTVARNEFGIDAGLFWSAKGTYLAFYQKDESKVHDYPLLDISATPGELQSIKYPMAGQASEEPKLGIYNLEKKTTVFIGPKGAKDDYLTNICFTPDERYILIAEVNRDQNHMCLNVYEAASGAFVKTLLEEKSEIWVEPEHTAFFPSSKSNNFIWISEKSGFNNLYYYDFNGQLIKQLTNHSFVVKDILSATTDGKTIFYKATGESPLNTWIYSVDLGSGKSNLHTTVDGTHNAAVSSDGKYIYDAFSSSSIAYKAQILTVSGNKQAKLLLESRDKLLDYKIGKATIGTLTGKDGSQLYYRMIQPSNFDPSKKYPVLVYVYGGPHAQMITNSWLNGANLWMYWMAEQGYIIFTLDNRGSAERGFAFESQIHRHLGDVEMEDQLKGVEFLKSLPYVDANRLAVHGWSFGGFMTTSLMLRQPGTFTVGVAGGPVTDWKYYEVMYGERYMDRPEQNKEGYEKASLLNHAQNLKGDLLLIHGTSDDVVVMQHNFALVKKFVDLGIQMDFFPYPMHKHNVTGVDRVHLMQKVLEYIIEHNK